MSLPIPASFEHGYVSARFALSVVDRGTTEDTDRHPDLIAATNVTVTFTPTEVLRQVDDEAPTMAVARTPTEAMVGTDGYIRPKNQPSAPPGVGLLVGVYTVVYAGIAIPPHTIEVTTAHTEVAPMDLLKAAPYIPPAGVEAHMIEVLGTALPGYVIGVNTSGDTAYIPLYIVIDAGDPVPPGTPDGTLVFQRA